MKRMLDSTTTKPQEVERAPRFALTSSGCNVPLTQNDPLGMGGNEQKINREDMQGDASQADGRPSSTLNDVDKLKSRLHSQHNAAPQPNTAPSCIPIA